MASRFTSAIRARLHTAEAIDANFNGRESDYWANRHVPQAVRAVKSLPKDVAAAFQFTR